MLYLCYIIFYSTKKKKRGFLFYFLITNATCLAMSTFHWPRYHSQTHKLTKARVKEKYVYTTYFMLYAHPLLLFLQLLTTFISLPCTLSRCLAYCEIPALIYEAIYIPKASTLLISFASSLPYI